MTSGFFYAASCRGEKRRTSLCAALRVYLIHRGGWLWMGQEQRTAFGKARGNAFSCLFPSTNYARVATAQDPVGAACMDARRFQPRQDVASENPRRRSNCGVSFVGGTPLSLVTFFAAAKKVTRPRSGRNAFDSHKATSLASRLRGNHEPRQSSRLNPFPRKQHLGPPSPPQTRRVAHLVLRVFNEPRADLNVIAVRPVNGLLAPLSLRCGDDLWPMPLRLPRARLGFRR